MATPLKIVLVEDSADDAALVERALVRAGIEAHCERVESEEGFLAQLGRDLDLVISDYSLPQFSGLRALELLRRSGLEVPFIIVSATIGEETAVEAIKAGAADYLLKDRLGRIGAAVLHVLEESRLRREQRVAMSNLRLFRKLLEHTTDGIQVIDPATGGFLDANERSFTSLGYSREEFLQLQVFDIAPHVTPGAYREYLERLRAVRSLVIEDQHRRKDGTVFPVEIGLTLITHQREYLVATVRDITPRKQAEERLRFQEMVLRDTGRIAKLGGWSFDVQSGEGHWTEEVARIHEVDPTAPTSKELGLSYYQGESRRKIEAAIDLAVKKGVPYDLDLEITTGKGTRKWVRTIGRPVEQNGAVVRLSGAIQDITQLKVAELALRESEGRFRQLAETIEEVFWMTDADKREMLYVSPAYEKIWGRSCASLGEHPRSWLDAIHPDDQAEVLAAMQTKQARGDYDETYRILRPDGTVRWIHDRAYPVKTNHGQPTRIVGVAEDITDRVNLEVQLLRAQRLEVIGTLAGGLAHDLNNILAPILMAAEMLDGRTADEKDEPLVTMVRHNAQRGAKIIRQLLTFTRGGEGHRDWVQCDHVMREIATIIRETFPREIKLVEDVPADLWPIKANVTQLHQVLMNLCVNARDAMAGGGVLTVALANCELAADVVAGHPRVSPGPFVRLTVSDTGRGISPDVIEKVFDPFFTTKNEGEGTGLGLATVLGIVQSHGGFITVESRPGKETTFAVHLPAAEAAQAETEPDEESPVGQGRGRGEQILVVDDEEQLREALRHVLLKQGYSVLVAANGREAVEVFGRNRRTVRLVVTDIMMPAMDGVALIEELRGLKPELPVVACTGLLDGEKQLALRALGISDILAKPFRAQDVIAAVQRRLVPHGTRRG